MIKRIIKILFFTLIISSLTGCLTKQKIDNLTEAENQVITQNGRHFSPLSVALQN